MNKDMPAAREALDCTKAAAAAIRASTRPDNFRHGWSAFLSEHGRTFNMIYCDFDMSSPAEVAWKSDLVIARTGDPLLRWLKEARDKRNHNGRVAITTITLPTVARFGFIPANSNNLNDFFGLAFHLPYRITLQPVPISATKSIQPPDSQILLAKSPDCLAV